MKTKNRGFWGMFLVSATMAGCAALADAGAVGGAGGSNFGGAGEPSPPTWSLHDPTEGWSNSGGAAPQTSDPGCTWPNPITQVHLTVPGFRSVASAPLARAVTTSGKLPDPLRVRPSDFLNYYRVRYPDPAVPTDIGFYAGVEPGDLDNQLVLQIAMQAPAEYLRPPVALAVVLDTSLSMAGDAWERARAAVAALAGALQPGDSLTLVTTKRAQKTASDAAAAAEIAAGLELDGGDDLAGALDDAYQVVNSAPESGAVGRVVLITDGAAQATSLDLDVISGEFQQGVPLIGVGVGDAPSYEGSLLEAATANGGGAHVYLDRADEADTLLGARFDELMITVATNIEVLVTLPPSLRVQSLQEAAKADSPTGLVTASLNAGRTLVIRNILETCEPNIGTALTLPIGIVVQYRRPASPGTDETATLGGVIGDLKHLHTPQMLKAGAISAYADALANAREPLLNVAADLSQAARVSDPALGADADLLEIESLIEADLAIIGAAAPPN